MKTKTNIKEMFSNTFTVIVGKNLTFFIVSLVAFGLLYSFFYGIFTIPVLEIGFYKDIKPGTFDYFYIASASLLSALIITLTKYSVKNLPKGVSFLGISSGVFAAICPVCLGINFLILGNVITIPLVFLVPYLLWIQLAGLVLLASGLWLTMKLSYENICTACVTEARESKKVGQELFGSFNPMQNYILFSLLAITVAAFGFQLSSLVSAPSITGATVATESSNVNVDEIASQVVPENGFTIEAKWKDTVNKMVKVGVLDINKFDNILAKRYGQSLTEEQKNLLTADYSDEKLTINSKNAVFMMYLLWVLAKHNDNAIIHASPWELPRDIGVGRDGWGDAKLIELTEEQQKIAEQVAQNAYRPCCGQPTSKPDCSHGFSALGLIQLMASQGFPKEEIFDAFVKFNSFWFPETYIMNAMYFKLAENKDWSEVDKEVVAGYQYSSIQGKMNVKKYLEGLGL